MKLEDSDKDSGIWPHRVAAHECLKDHNLHNTEVHFLVAWLKGMASE